MYTNPYPSDIVSTNWDSIKSRDTVIVRAKTGASKKKKKTYKSSKHRAIYRAES